MGLTSREHILNADPADQQRLLDVQERDTRLGQIAHRRATLPELAALAEAEARRNRARDELIAAQTILADLELELNRSEADVEVVRERTRKDQQLLDSGSINDPKQLQNLQHELQSLARRQGELEELELEVMERADGAQKAVASLSATRDGLDAECVELASAVQQRLAELDAERVEVEAERQAIAATVPADLLALYERLRADLGGVGAAHLHRGRCEGCRLQLTANDLEQLRAARPDEVVRCEECRRILVRTAESGL